MRRGLNSGPHFRVKIGPPFQSGFKNAPTSENVDHLPRDKFSVDRFAFCMSLMVTLANCSHRTSVSDLTKSATLTGEVPPRVGKFGHVFRPLKSTPANMGLGVQEMLCS